MLLGIAQNKDNGIIEEVKPREKYYGESVIDFFTKGNSMGNEYTNYADYRIKEAKYITDASLELIYE